VVCALAEVDDRRSGGGSDRGDWRWRWHLNPNRDRGGKTGWFGGRDFVVGFRWRFGGVGLFAALERGVECVLVVRGSGQEEAVAGLFGNRSKLEFTGPSSTLCMCACIALSHPRRSFEASQLEGNNSQRRQRHLWRPRNNSRPDVHLVRSHLD